MPEWKDWIAALASLFASFAGAWAAFAFERMRRTQEEDEKRIGAANRAIYTVYQYWNTLEQYRKEALEPNRDRADVWLNLPAHVASPVVTERFNATDLQFLLQHEQATTYVKLMLEEQRFLLAINLIQERSRLVLNEVFPRMAQANIGVGQALPANQLERILGLDVTHKLKEITEAIYKNVDEDLLSLVMAHDELRGVMKILYPRKKFLQVIFESEVQTS